MSSNEIPVRVIGPGSQPDTGQDLRYIDMPRDMMTFRAPCIPEPDAVAHLEGARETTRWLSAALERYEYGAEPHIANLTGLDAENRALVNQILGEGEVSVACSGAVVARCQESILAGVWRTLYFDADDRVVCDLLEVAAVPHLLNAAAEASGAIDTAPPDVPDDVLNALPILVELQAQVDGADGNGKQHSINLSLLPLSDSEIAFLEERLGRGSVDVLSRGYGNCEVLSTRIPNVWWVRYFNSMGTLILNSIEVVAVPEVLIAAEEDLRDSATRLGEILAPYWSDSA